MSTPENLPQPTSPSRLLTAIRVGLALCIVGLVAAAVQGYSALQSGGEFPTYGGLVAALAAALSIALGIVF